MDLEHFAALQGRRFTVQAGDALAIQAELIEACRLPMPATQGRQAFSLLFKGPVEPVLPQRTYRLQHEADAEPLDIFLVPVSADASGVCYEAVFA